MNVFLSHIAISTSQNTANVWRLVARTPSKEGNAGRWSLHMIDFFEHFVVDEFTGARHCFSPIPLPHNGMSSVFASGWQSGYDVENVFAGEVGKPWKANFKETPSGESAWIGIDFLQKVTVGCVKVYQSKLATHEGKAQLILESRSGGEWQQQADWNFEWSSLSGHHLKSMWMTLAIGEPAENLYTECSVGILDWPQKISNCCVWPSILYADEMSARDSPQFWTFTDKSNPKCTPGGTVSTGTRCPIASTSCPGFQGFFHCANDTVRIETSHAHQYSEALEELDPGSQDQCSEMLELPLRSGSRLRIDHVGHMMLMSQSDNAMSKAQDVEKDSEEEDQEEEDDEDWSSKILHDSKLRAALITVSIVMVLCSVGFIARKLQQNSNPLERLQDEPEASQPADVTTFGHQINSGIICDPKEVALEMQS